MSVHPNTFSLLAATHADIPALAKLSGDSFEVDRHTEMKMQGRVPYDMEGVWMESLPGIMDSERHVVVKAVDNVTGEVMGWCAWGFRGFERDEIPRLDGGAPSEKDDEKAGDNDIEKEEDDTEQKSKEEELVKPDDRDESIKRLEAMTSADLDKWMEKLMPPGTKCIYITSLSVGPQYQKRGVGSGLIKWGTDTANEHGVFIWVHSSEGGWGAYAKAGFEVIGTLDVDLDEWSVGPPKEGGKWGHYVFRYMKYLPRPTRR
jgi:GNAT superfamily N-acetyltransferase